MTTVQKIKKLEKEMAELRSLFSALVPFDTEGEYKDSFITQMKNASSQKATGSYSRAGSLLSLVSLVK